MIFWRLHFVVIAILAVIGPIQASAQNSSAVAVRAAEHPRYSRIVVPLATGQSWSLERDGMQATLTLTGDVRFDISRVFQRMPRTRILSVSSFQIGDRSGLVATIGCDCDAIAEMIGSRFLALDIRQRDGAGEGNGEAATADAVTPAELEIQPQVRAEEEILVEVADNSTPVRPQTVGDLDAQILAPPAALKSEQSRVQALREGPRTDFSTAERPSTIPGERRFAWGERSNPSDIAVAPRAIDPSGRTELDTVRAQLLNEVLAAAGQGLLELDQANDGDKTASSELFSRLPRQVAIRSALDRRRSSVAAEHEEEADHCVADDALSFETWLGDEPVFEQLGTLRRSIVDQRQRPIQSKVKDLARFYLSIGFGAEAGAVINSFGLTGPETSLLLDLARVVDGHRANPGGPLEAAHDCPGRVVLWRTAAGFVPDTLTGEDRITLREGLASLPAPVRTLIGGRIATRLIDHGVLDPATDLLEVLDRTPARPTPQTRLALARLHTATGRETQGDEQLEILARSNSDVSHEALKTRVTRELAARRQVSLQDETDLDIEARRLAGTSEAVPFILLSAEVKAERGALETAFGMIDAAIVEHPEDADSARRLGARLLAAVDPEKTGQASYARTVLAHRHFFGQNREATVHRVKVASSLTDLGMPNLALDLLDESRALASDQTALVKGRALLATGRPDEALAVLDAVDTLEAAEVRATALAQTGAFGPALSVASDANPADESVPRYALLARDWDALSKVPSPSSLSALAEALGSNSNDGNEETDTKTLQGDLRSGSEAQAELDVEASFSLANLRSQLQQSASFRATVSDADASLR